MLATRPRENKFLCLGGIGIQAPCVIIGVSK